MANWDAPDLFPEVRSYEYFKYLHLGLISEKKRKTFPEIAEIAGLENSQGIDYFIGKSEWSVEEVRERLKSQKTTIDSVIA
jgi:SRSO17 transposase